MRENDHIKLLDGQQRLATATIALAVIRDLSAEYGEEKGKHFASETQRTLIEKDADQGTFSLRLGELDDRFFRSTTQYYPKRKVKQTVRSHRLISEARNLLEQVLRDDLGSKRGDAAQIRLRSLRSVLASSLVMVSIEVSTEDDAYHI